jgi:hypothetical protein
MAFEAMGRLFESDRAYWEAGMAAGQRPLRLTLPAVKA